MAVKTFTTGEVLTAADTNTYLANSGLQYVSSGTFTNAASFDVTGISSTWTHYLLTITAKRYAANAAVTGQLVNGSTVRASDYYGAQWYVSYLSTTGIYYPRNNASTFGLMDVGSSESFATIQFAGVGDQSFRCTMQTFDALATFALTGGYSNYNASSAFDKIRFTATNNITGYWNLMGVRKG